MTSWPPGARDFVAACKVGRLATCGEDRMPHAVPICFVLIDDRLYSVVDAKPKRSPLALKRLRNVADNPRAAVVVDRYDDDWSRLVYVLMRGEAAVVADEKEYDRALAALREKYPQYRSMELARVANPMMRVEVETVHYWVAADRSRG